MYQELNTVYGDQCTTLAQQSSFETEDGFNQSGINSQAAYRPYTYGVTAEANLPSHLYAAAGSSPSGYGSQTDLRQISTTQSMLAMPGYGDNQHGLHHDLPAIINRQDLQWITTSNTDLRTQSPANSSSPRVNAPPPYHQPSSPLNRTLHNQGSFEDSASSSIAISHHQIAAHRFAAPNVNPPPLQRVRKRTPPANTPMKPKGTPGRKRKFQDYELSPAEASKRHIRRERNKVAAAKCRNRRRELTDRLQGETDHLEDCQSLLHQEIITLQQEKEHLEFILASHSPNCKARISTNDSSLVSRGGNIMTGGISEVTLVAPPEVMEGVMANNHSDIDMMHSNQRQENSYYFMQPSNHPGPAVSTNTTTSRAVNESIVPGITTATDLSHRGQAFSSIQVRSPLSNMTLNFDATEAPLNTPVCTLTTPTNCNTSGRFTFPGTPVGMPSTARDGNFAFPNSSADVASSMRAQTTLSTSYTDSSATSFSTAQTRGGPLPNPQTCAAAHRRNSSSDSYHSPDSVKSPAKLMAL